jgi:hypothetical protein
MPLGKCHGTDVFTILVISNRYFNWNRRKCIWLSLKFTISWQIRYSISKKKKKELVFGWQYILLINLQWRCIRIFWIKSLLLIKHVCVLIIQRSRFFVEFLELISLIGLSYSSNNVTISMIICVEIKFFSQFCLLHEMLYNLGVQLLYFISFFLRLSSIMNFNFS